MDDRTRDLLIMAMTAFEEAGGEGEDGIRAQVHSVLNRQHAGRWYSKKTLAATCLAPYAYSCWLPNDATGTASAAVPMTDPVMQTCSREAEAAVLGLSKDTTEGATHYYAAGTPEPDWVSGISSKTGQRVAPPATFLKQIGKHLFYKDVQ